MIKIKNEIMQKSTKCYMGIDVSKLWFDIALLIVVDGEKHPMAMERFDNNPGGLKKLDKWLKQHKVPFNEDSFVVIESTGLYHRLIWHYCSMHQLPIHIGNAARIKWSLGITRGKSDKVDSQRICMYCFRNADELEAAPALDPVFLQLKDLSAMRGQLKSELTIAETYLNELKSSKDAATYKKLEAFRRPSIDGVKKSIKAVEAEMISIIKANASMKRNYDLLLTVPGIGSVTAMYLICCTNNFLKKITGKQLACYAGVVPFGSTSGSSVKGRNKVHPMCNKDLKKLLHMGAVSSIQNHPEFRAYYERKKAEGKHNMSILNAIRNKIVLRVVAVVNNQKEYVNNYQKVA